MDDDAALAQILAANDGLTLVVNAYKEQTGAGQCGRGRAKSTSEEETRKKTGTGHVVHLLVHVDSSSALLCVSHSFPLLCPAPTSPREIKSYHLIDLSALDSPQTHRKSESLPEFKPSSPLYSSRLEFSEAEQVLNELGGPACIPISGLLCLTLMNMLHSVACFMSLQSWTMYSQSRLRIGQSPIMRN